jgi:hypothetical protein
MPEPPRKGSKPITPFCPVGSMKVVDCKKHIETTRGIRNIAGTAPENLAFSIIY